MHIYSLTAWLLLGVLIWCLVGAVVVWWLEKISLLDPKSRSDRLGIITIWPLALGLVAFYVWLIKYDSKDDEPEQEITKEEQP